MVKTLVIGGALGKKGGLSHAGVNKSTNIATRVLKRQQQQPAYVR